jgi:hypothetical protein
VLHKVLIYWSFVVNFVCSILKLSRAGFTNSLSLLLFLLVNWSVFLLFKVEIILDFSCGCCIVYLVVSNLEICLAQIRYIDNCLFATLLVIIGRTSRGLIIKLRINLVSNCEVLLVSVDCNRFTCFVWGGDLSELFLESRHMFEFCILKKNLMNIPSFWFPI